MATVNGDDNDNKIETGNEDDTVNTFGGNDAVFTFGGNDTINAGAGDDFVEAGDGNDDITMGDGADTAYGQAGNDTFRASYGSNTYYGGADSDFFYIGHGQDTIFGGETGVDNDFILSEDDTDGNDALTVTYTGDEQGTFSEHAGPAGGTFEGIEGWELSDYDDVLDASVSTTRVEVWGDSGNDTITGGSGDDDIAGEAGDDTLSGNAGADEFLVGDGTDTAYGGAGNDTFYASQGVNTYYGGGDADTFSIGFNVDTVYGGEGGNDFDTLGAYEDQDANDALTVTFTGDEQGTFFDLDGDSGSFYEIEILNLTDFDDTVDGSASNAAMIVVAEAGDDTITGGEGDDTLAGGAGSDILRGNGGNDTLVGDIGDDTFLVGADDGNDNIQGGDGTDTIAATVDGSDLGLLGDFGAANSIEVISSDGFTDFNIYGDDGASQTLDFSGVKLDGVAGIYGEGGDDTIIGSGTHDNIFGGDGSDTLSGGTGNDVITGGTGDDTISTGTGQDTIRIVAGSGTDTITDFDLGDRDGDGFYNDQLDVSGLTDLEGNPVNTFDVVVTDDGFGNAKLSFPNGESIIMQGVAPSQMSSASQQRAAGVPCFTPGTRIATPDGPRAIERLRPGDLVSTRDNGPQPITWIGDTRIGPATLKARPHLAPIHLRKGLLGARRDLLVSPQHGLLWHGTHLVRAVHLARHWDGRARIARGKRAVHYIHLMLDRHEILDADGVACESFYPGPFALGGLAPPARTALLALRPELACAVSPEITAAFYGPAARPYLPARALRRARDKALPPRALLA